MRCSICHRPLLHCAVPGLQIGETCARKRGILPERQRRMRIIEPSRQHLDPKQVDWINLINSTRSGAESVAT